MTHGLVQAKHPGVPAAPRALRSALLATVP